MLAEYCSNDLNSKFDFSIQTYEDRLQIPTEYISRRLMSNPKVHVLTCIFCPCASELMIGVTIRKDSNMPGSKGNTTQTCKSNIYVPFFGWVYRYSFFSLQKLSSTGIKNKSTDCAHHKGTYDREDIVYHCCSISLLFRFGLCVFTFLYIYNP